jgi:hypothetical protein
MFALFRAFAGLIRAMFLAEVGVEFEAHLRTQANAIGSQRPLASVLNGPACGASTGARPPMHRLAVANLGEICSFSQDLLTALPPFSDTLLVEGKAGGCRAELAASFSRVSAASVRAHASQDEKALDTGSRPALQAMQP